MGTIKSIGDTFRFLKSNPRAFVPGIVSGVFILFISLVLMRAIPPIQILSISNVLPIFLILLVNSLLTIYLSFWVVAIAGAKNPDLKTTAGEALRLFPTGLAATILFGLILIGGFVLFIIPGIYLAVRFLFVEQAVIVDKKGVVDSLRYSWNLTKGKWWATFGFSLLLSIIMIIILVPSNVSTMFSFFEISKGNIAKAEALDMFSTLYSALTAVFITPFFNTVLTFYYLARKGGKPKDSSSHA